MLDISQKYQHKIANRCVLCAQWLHDLPTILETLAQKWHLQLGEPYPKLSYNYVTTVQCENGTTAVLKLCLPDDAAWYNEVEALRTFGGHGAIKLLDYDYANRALLLQHLPSAQTLDQIQELPASIKIVSKVIMQLQKNPPLTTNLPHIRDFVVTFSQHLSRYSTQPSPIPIQLLNQSQHLYLKLVQSSSQNIVLHGDLHPHNILSSDQTTWLAIDPKGYIGDPSYETGAYIRNILISHSDAPSAAKTIIESLSQTINFPAPRIRDWAFAQAILASCWCLEENDQNYQKLVSVALILQEVQV